LAGAVRIELPEMLSRGYAFVLPTPAGDGVHTNAVTQAAVTAAMADILMVSAFLVVGPGPRSNGS
jgi:hypothetical protein